MRFYQCDDVAAAAVEPTGRPTALAAGPTDAGAAAAAGANTAADPAAGTDTLPSTAAGRRRQRAGVSAKYSCARYFAADHASCAIRRSATGTTIASLKSSVEMCLTRSASTLGF